MNRFIFILLFLFIGFQNFASIFHSVEHKIHREITNGDYKHALKSNRKLIRKISKKYADSTHLINSLLIQQAYIKALMDEPFTVVKEGFTEGLTKIEAKESKESPHYKKALLDIFDIYVSKGYYIEADSLISMMKEEKDTSFIDEIALREIPLLIKLGFYTDAYLHAKKLKKYVLKNVQKTVTYKNRKGAIITKELPADEFRTQQRAYANHLNLIGQILIEKGDFKAAEKVLSEAKLWIETNMTNNDIATIDNIILRGIIKNEMEKRNEAQIFFEEALKMIGHTFDHFQYLETSPRYGNLVEQLTMAYWKDGKTELATDIVNDYSPKIKRFYKSNNYHRGFLDLLEAEKYFIKANYEKSGKLGVDFIVKGLKTTDNYASQYKALEKLIPIYEELEDYFLIEEMYNRIDSLKEIQFPKKAPKYHEIDIHKAIYLTRYTNKFKEALPIFDTSFTKIVKKNLHPMHPKHRYFSNSLADLYEIMGNYKEAKELLIETRNQTIDNYHPTDYRIALQQLRIANLDIEIGDYKEAKELLKNIESIYEVNDNSNAEGRDKLYVYYGKIYLLTGQYAEAEHALKKAHRYSKNNEYSQKDIAEFATLYIKRGEYTKVEEILLETIEIKEGIYGSESRHLLTSFNQLAELYLITGVYTDADHYIDRAIQIAFNIYGEDALKYANSLNLQANIAATIGDFEHALNDYQHVLNIQKKLLGDDHISVATTLTELAITQFLKDKNTENTLELLEKAAGIVEKQLGKENPLYAESLEKIATYYISIGELQKADKYLEQANFIWLNKAGLGKLNINSTNILALRSDIMKEQSKNEEALELLKTANHQYKKIFHDEHPEYVKTLSKMAQLYYIMGNQKKSVKTLNKTTEIYVDFISNYFDALSERQKTKFWYLIQPDFEFFHTIALNSKSSKLIAKTYDHTLQTKALLLNSSIALRKAITQSKNDSLIAKFNDWQERKEKLGTYIGLSTEQLKEENISLDQEEKIINALEKELSESSEEFKKEKLNKTYTWKDVKSKLQENEYAIEIIRYRYFEKDFTDSLIYAALVVSPTTKKAPEVIILKNGNLLEKKYISYYQNTMKYQIEDELSYKVFWEQIHKVVGDNSTIFLSTEGVYTQINIESLKTPDNQYVLDKNNIVLVSNTKDLSRKNTNRKIYKKNTHAVVMGNPAFYDANISTTGEPHGNRSIEQSVAQLPGAEEEVGKVHNLLKAGGWHSEKRIYETATEQFVREEMQSPRVFHVATHGFFLDDVEIADEEKFGFISRQEMKNPLLRSGLMFQHAGDIFENSKFYHYNKEPGILTANEAMTLQLDSTELVILSACETGLGEIQIGEGVQGLQKAFLVAGANNIIMSLFKVSDEATNKLMSTFYAEWIKTADKRLAFIKAKKAVREEFPEPIYWGAFIMIGL